MGTNYLPGVLQKWEKTEALQVMAGVDYCTILPSWDFDKDPACVVRYYFGQDTAPDPDLGDGELDQYDERLGTHDSLELFCPKCEEDGSVEACTLTVTCKSQYRVSICGVHIVSQTRFIELYDTGEVYISTSKGAPVQCQQDCEGGEDTQVLYKCRAKLDDKQYGVTIKFPKANGLQRLTIYQISLILHPEVEEEPDTLSSKDLGMIDIDKVKGYVGDTLPEGARDLLHSMEEYQKKQKEDISGYTGALSSAANSNVGMMGLLSMFTNLNRTSSVKDGEQRRNTASQSVPGRKPDLSRLSKLLMTGNNSAGTTTNAENENGSGEMFNVLHNICGAVTQMRQTSAQSEEQPESTETAASAVNSESSSNSNHESPRVNPESVAGITVEEYDKMLKKTEERLKEHIDSKLAEIEQRLSAKIDSLLQCLKKTDKEEESPETGQ